MPCDTIPLKNNMFLNKGRWPITCKNYPACLLDPLKLLKSKKKCWLFASAIIDKGMQMCFMPVANMLK